MTYTISTDFSKNSVKIIIKFKKTNIKNILYKKYRMKK